MNILALSRQFMPSVGGAETFLYSLYKTMAGSGHKIVLITTLWNCPPETKTEEIVDGIQVYRVKNVLQMARKVMSLKGKFDVIHAHSYGSVLAGLPAKVFRKIPLFFEPHEYTTICLNGSLYRDGAVCEKPLSRECFKCADQSFLRSGFSMALRRLILPRIDGWIFPSKYVAHRTSSAYEIPENKIRTIYEGVDHEQFRSVYKAEAREFLMEQGYIEEEDIVILITSRLEQAKGQRIVLEAIPRIVEKNSQVKFLLVGYGEDYSYLVSLSKRLKVDKNAVFTGKVEPSKMPYFYRGADIFVMPSLWPEVFGLVTLEAMASGLPVVGTNRGATPELMKDGENGFIIEPTVGALVERLSMLIEDEKLREKMSDESLSLSRDFSWKKCGEEMFEALTKLVT